MANETTTTEAASAVTPNETPSPLQETPSSTVDNIPQAEGDFATWLSDRLDKFEKGEETAPWAQKQEEEPKAEEKQQEETEAPSPEAEQATEETTKEEEPAEDIDDSEDTKSMSAAAGAKFKELKAELKQYKAQLAEAQKAVEESKSTQANSEEIEFLRSKLAEYEQEISVTRVEATPEYKRAVLEPTQVILDAASTLAERYKLDSRKLVNALREESATEGSDALTELAGDFSERDRVRLYRMADDLADVARRREFLRENASKAMADMEAQRAVYEKEQVEIAKKEMSEAVTRTWAELFQQKDFVSSMDSKTLEDVKKYAQGTDYYDTSLDERAYAVYSGLLLPHVVGQLEAAQAKTAELEKALSKYKKATPKVSGNTDTTPAVAEDVGFLDAIEKRFSNG